MDRIGLFGGTFDPPHLGHLAIAERARERLRLDRVIFMPSGVPPHKRGREVSPAEARVAMTRLAVRGNPGFRVSALEARRGGASYTVDTLLALRAAHPRARFYLVIGEDSLEEFSGWRQPDSILELATLAVAPRSPVPASRHGARAARAPREREGGRRRRPDARIGRSRLGVEWLDGPEFGMSSSEIRARARAGRSVRYLVPEGVAAYIRRHRLYRGMR